MKTTLILLQIFLVPTFAVAAIDLKLASQKLDDLYRSNSSQGIMEMNTKSGTNQRRLKLKVWSKGKNLSLIVIQDPPRESGSATLKVDKNLWNYLPKIGRTVRIPTSMMLSSWMGTDFTNDDLVKGSSFEEDFNSKDGGLSKSPAGQKIIYEVKPGKVGRWQKIEIIVNSELLPLQSQFFDRKGRLSRTMIYSDIQTMGGRKIPSRIMLKVNDQDARETEIHYVEMKFDIEIKDDVFSLSRLEQK
jgi:outer membrane lipoprotein-sorting protein